MSTISGQLASWAARTRFEDLPDKVIRQVKRLCLDAVGCAIGGSRQHDVALVRQVLDQIAGSGRSRILVTGELMDPVSAALLNSLMIRVMDYNDIYWKQDPSHPSDVIPAVMASAEHAGGSGRDLLLGIAIAYEVEQRLCEVSVPGIREIGWHHATLTAIAAPVAAGRMLGLDAAQIQNAIGISASRHCTTGSVTAGKLTMMKNTVDPMAVQSGVLAALLAGTGYTGPEHVLDGKEGLSHVLDTAWRWEILTEGLGDHWRILECGMKYFPTEALTHTPLSAMLDIIHAHDLHPETIRSVTIHSLARAADILADPSKYDPQTKETADHSLPYVIAAAIVDRQMTPRQLELDRILDPVVRAQLPKINVIADPEIEAVFPGLQRARVVVETIDGRTLNRVLDYPKGDPRNPLTDDEIMDKLRFMAEGVVSPESCERIRAVIEQAEQLDDVCELMTALVFRP